MPRWRRRRRSVASARRRRIQRHRGAVEDGRQRAVGVRSRRQRVRPLGIRRRPCGHQSPTEEQLMTSARALEVSCRGASACCRPARAAPWHSENVPLTMPSTWRLALH
jgi:hypothetical protein